MKIVPSLDQIMQEGDGIIRFGTPMIMKVNPDMMPVLARTVHKELPHGCEAHFPVI